MMFVIEVLHSVDDPKYLTSIGAAMNDKVIDFSSGIISSALLMITKVSPEGTALTRGERLLEDRSW